MYKSPNLASERRIRGENLLCTKNWGLPVLTLYKNISIVPLLLIVHIDVLVECNYVTIYQSVEPFKDMFLPEL